MVNPADLGSNTEGAVVAIGAALVAIAVPLNTFFLVILNRRQKEGNHHTETIRKLASALADTPVGAPPEEVGERVTEALAEDEGAAA